MEMGLWILATTKKMDRYYFSPEMIAHSIYIIIWNVYRRRRISNFIYPISPGYFKFSFFFKKKKKGKKKMMTF